MEYHSILFESSEKEPTGECCEMPDFFPDLNLDQVVDEILSNKEEYKLREFFYKSLGSTSAINYRLEVMKDLDNVDIFGSFVSFSNELKRVREYFGFSSSLHNRYQREKWHLDALNLYCKAVIKLDEALISSGVNSLALKSFSNWLSQYAGSDYFIRLHKNTEALHKEFESIRYSIKVEKDKVTLEFDESVEDYCSLINSTFENINETGFNYPISFFTGLEMCSLENNIIDILRKMNIDVFNKLDEYFRNFQDSYSKDIGRFDREIQFYISYIEFIEKLKRNGFNFAYPQISLPKKINVTGGYDLALAYKLLNSGENVVSNDYYLEADERIFILTGPNQGGKTTFARAFGQILFLASIGCPVPCKNAQLFLFSNIFTHFSSEESLSTKDGRLKEELTRLKQIIGKASNDSVIIINELFATTTSHDAYTMGKKVLEYFLELDCVCLYVTHIYELANISSKTVSLVAAVDSENSDARTYKITRKSADGYAYANAIVEKYDLTYNRIKERLFI